MAERDLIEVEVANVLVSDNNFLVILKEKKNGKRLVPISVGVFEANGILMALEGITTRRPFTYDILKTILLGSGVRVRRLIINELRDDIFFGILTIVDNEGEKDYDIRPSDGIAISLRFGSPIYVAEKVFEILERERKQEEMLIKEALEKQIEEERESIEDESMISDMNEILDNPLTDSKTQLEEKLEKMNLQLEKAVSEERYEDAARLRDEIEALKNKLNRE